MTIENNGSNDQKAFYLSFDGSPNPPATDRLLNALDDLQNPGHIFYGRETAGK